ncbi:hypothetical protein MFIFM68171_02029 [Madurella fahalii]|uniref:Uncharacterized protein n=1 Tax=Madurella fahalii TaxID=1157608 RepID=A0ABQ0G2A8_9PEZI
MAVATVMPKGFFGNTQEIYAEVASYSVVPPEKIRQYWNVYTTTFRRLVDPSAFRLENFWWHVWGSDKRNLSGPALAKLFEEFSNGPTIVPFTLPSHRHERPPMPNTVRRDINGTSPQQVRPPDSSPGQESASSESKKAPTPSSSRPPPPHPILKKSRGPSASGPRPTARFASPPCRDDEGSDSSEARSTSAVVTPSDMPPPPLPSPAKQKQTVAPAAAVSTAEMPPPPLPSAKTKKAPPPVSVVTGAEMRPPPLTSPLREKANSSSRKVVAATAASRRRPVVMRRQSSQSSTGSDTGPRVAGFVNASTKQPGGGNKRQTPTTAQLLGHGSLSPQTNDPGANAKAAGKRPAKAAASKRSSPRTVPVERVNQSDEVAGVRKPQTTSPQRTSTADARDGFASQEATQSRNEAVRQPAAIPPPVAGFVADAPMVRSRSNNENPYRLREPGVALLPSQATSSVAMFTTTARGQFDSETVKPEPAVPEARDIPDRVKFASQPSSSVLLDLQFKPTPPNPSPPIPFGRSRSELTLLLEREKARKGDGS